MEENLEQVLRGWLKKLGIEDSEILEDANHYLSIAGVPQTKYAAGAAVYIASKKGGRPRTQKEIANVGEISEASVRDNYKKIVDLYNSGQAGI